jgi:hypothetical protein
VTEKAYVTVKILNMIDYININNFVSHGSDCYITVRKSNYCCEGGKCVLLIRYTRL